MLARILGRHKMFLHASDHGFACHVAMDGYWEIWLTQFFARTIKPGMVAIDVGANYGYYTLLFGDAVTRSGRVLAVEPNPGAAALLRDTVLLNGLADRIRVVESALGPPGLDEAPFFIPWTEPKNARVVGDEIQGGGDTVMVPVTTLDALAADLPAIDIIKIDAEGAELGILDGMRHVLRRHRPKLVLEFNAMRYPNPAAFLHELLALYGQVQVISFSGIAEPIAPDTILTTRAGQDWNLLFTPPDAGA